MSRDGAGNYNLPAGNPVVAGTLITDTWGNNTMSDVAAALTASMTRDGQGVPTADIPMGSHKLTGLSAGSASTDSATFGQVQSQAQSGALIWIGSISGTDTITGSLTPAISSYSAGQLFAFLSSGANTTVSVTININGLGAKAIKKYGSNALSIGDIRSGQVILISYNGTNFDLLNYSRTNPGNIKDIGAVGDGVVDDKAAIQTALNSVRAVYLPTPSASYYISDSVSPVANQLIYGDGYSSLIKTKDGSVNGIYGSSIAGVTIRDLQIATKTQSNATAYKAGILAYTCSNWRIDNVFFQGMGYWGIGLFDSNNNIAYGCRFSSFFGSGVGDSADIAMHNNSNYNLVDACYCFGGNEHGIIIQDPYTGATPTGNKITKTQVGQHINDGIILYVTTVYDTQTVVDDVLVRDILGTGLSGNSGHGVYFQTGNGAILTNSVIVNCCRSTSTFETQVVGHVGISTGDSTVYPGADFRSAGVYNCVIIAPRGPGIYSATCGAPINVNSNIIYSTGTTAVRGEAILFVGVNGARGCHNIIKHKNTNYAMMGVVAGDGQTLDGHDISHNTGSGLGSGLSINISGTTGSHTNSNIHANYMAGNLSGAAYFLQKITNCAFTNNTGFSSSSTPAFEMTSCSDLRMGFCKLSSSHTPYAIIFTGTGSRNYADQTNIFDGRVENDPGSGMLIKQLGDSVPASWLVNVGDRWERITPASGSWLYRVCTTLGITGSTAVFTDLNLP